MRRDLDGDGLTVGTGEQIRYWLDGRILREQGNPVAEGVTTTEAVHRLTLKLDVEMPMEDSLTEEQQEIVESAAVRLISSFNCAVLFPCYQAHLWTCLTFVCN